MRRLILILAVIGLIFWSLLAWAASGLLGFAEGIAATSAPFIPLPPELVYWVAGLMSGAGGVLVWVVWFIGAAIIALVTMVLLAFVPRDRHRASADRYGTTYDPIRPRDINAEPGRGRTDEPGRGVAPNTAISRPPSGADTRSAEEIVSRVLGKQPPR